MVTLGSRYLMDNAALCSSMARSNEAASDVKSSDGGLRLNSTLIGLALICHGVNDSASRFRFCERDEKIRLLLTRSCFPTQRRIRSDIVVSGISNLVFRCLDRGIWRTGTLAEIVLLQSLQS